MHLSSLKLHDEFLVRSSDEVIDFLRGWSRGKCDAFSIDVEDLFYFVPHQAHFTAVTKCIDKNGETAFGSSCGMSVEIHWTPVFLS